MRYVNKTGDLAELLRWYVTDWGPIEWRDSLANASVEIDNEMGRMLYSLSLIEADSQVQRRKLAAAGADRVQELLDFIVIWLAEEGEHSRALAHMARMFGFQPEPLATRTPMRDVRSLATWPGLYLARTLPGICATYCTLGTAQELVALTTYNHLANATRSDSVASILRSIARQESKHMRFYRNAAVIFLRDSKSARRTTRRLIERLWRPPGMDLLGTDVYEDVFDPILRNSDYAADLLRVDRVLQELPGMRGVEVMRRYLESHDYLRRSEARTVETHA